MKYALLFAATAAASYDAYGGYGGAESSSAPAKVSSAAVSSAPAYGGHGSQPSASSKAPSAVSSAASSKATPSSTSVGQNGYTTVVPGYGKPPVTVTSQYQAIPTCVAQGYDSKSCAKWGEDKYVSTTLTDADKKVVTVTNVKDCVTIYHEKKTITHSATPTLGGYAAPSSYPDGAKNSTGTWYELYEKIHVVEYENIGKNALPGYSGSGLCHECDNAQPYTIKECKDGKCSEKKKTFNYGKPKDEVKVYVKPGVYTVPAKVVTVYPSAPTGPAGNGNGNGHPKAPEAGVYTYEAKTITITKPNQQYTCTYELPKQTPSKGEEHPASATKTPSRGEEYPGTKTKVDNNGYKASSIPNVPANEYPSYPNVPAKSKSTSSAHDNGYGSAPSSAPWNESETLATPTPTSSKPVEYGNTASSAPAYGKAASSAPTYGNAASSSAPAYVENSYGAHSTPVMASSSKPAAHQPVSSSPAPYGNTGYGGEKPSASVSVKASSTPCESELKHVSTPAATATPHVPVYGGNKASSSAPVYNGEKSSSAPVYGGNKSSSPAPAYAGSSSAPAKASSTPSESESKHASTTAATPTPHVPVYGGNRPSSSAPVYNAQKSSSAPVYGASSSAPAKASPTPYAPVYGNDTPSSSAPSNPSTTPALYIPVSPNYKPSAAVPAAPSDTPYGDEIKTPATTPSAPAPAYPNAPPATAPAAYDDSNGAYGGAIKPVVPAPAAGGYGYAKRESMMERRKRAVVEA